MNFNHTDTIKLSKEDYLHLFEWKNNNRHSVRNFNPILNEGVIVIENHIKQYFKQDGTNIYYEAYLGDTFFFYLITQQREDGQVLLKEHQFNDEALIHMKYSKDAAISDAITLHASLMAYMEYFMENKVYIQKVAIQKPIKNKKKRKDKRKAQVIKIQRQVYKVKVGSNTKEVQTTRKITRIAEKWTVRGHWRQLKDGRKVWISPYSKGTGKEVTPKTYTL